MAEARNKGKAKRSDRLLSEQEILDANTNFLKSLSLEAAKQLSSRPKNGEIYKDEASLKSTNIKERLKKLSERAEYFSIDRGNEVADAARVLKSLGKTNHQIELAAQKAYSGALYMIQAEILQKKGREKLDQSKLELKSA